jgi:hypothetical protein
LTTIEEQHVNKVEDNSLFEGQVRQHRDSTDHSAKERTIVDKGTTVTENVHHHIHHVIQPVIEKNGEQISQVLLLSVSYLRYSCRAGVPSHQDSDS